MGNKHSKGYLKKFLLVSYKDILLTEMEMLFSDIDPEQKGHVTEDAFHQLLQRTSKMGPEKISWFYKKLRGLSKTVGVSLDDIAQRIFDLADIEEKCGASELLVRVLKDMQKSAPTDLEE